MAALPTYLKSLAKSPLFLSTLVVVFLLLLSGCGETAFRISTNSSPTVVWIWVDGSTTPNMQAVYGIKDVAAVNNVPGARNFPLSWTDATGNLWLFGGAGSDPTSGLGTVLNDLWKYSPTANEWTWVSGNNTPNARGIYGTLNVPSANNLPGARVNSVAWIDSGGHLWLFGGLTADSTSGATGLFNDLWEFDPATKNWTWVNGSNQSFAAGSYGAQNIAAPSNVPGARSGAVAWTDGDGNFLMFGGRGVDSSGEVGNLNDLWEFNPMSKLWTWVSGSSLVNSTGDYGMKGVAAPANVPPPRYGAAGWIDSAQNLWLFGGASTTSSTSPLVPMNDLWKFNLVSKSWTWIGGSNTPNARGVYGSEGTANGSNVPGARSGSGAWIDSSGNLWLFGGSGFDSVGTNSTLGDLWKYNPANGTWTWISGSKIADTAAVFGSKGVASTGNVPAATDGPATWGDRGGKFWMFGGHSIVTGGPGSGLNNQLWSFQP